MPSISKIDLSNDIVNALAQSSVQICGNPNLAMAHLAAVLWHMHKVQAPKEFKETQHLVVFVDMIWKQLDQNSAANVVNGGNA